MIYPTWLNPGDNAWQITAATLVGLMSVPGLVVLYGGVMQKRWSVNSMMLTFSRSPSCSSSGCCRASRWASARPCTARRRDDLSVLLELHRHPGLGARRTRAEQGQAEIPSITGPAFNFPTVDPGLLPARLRRDHADPDARLGARPRELQGVDAVRPSLVDVHLHGQRLPDLGRRLVRAARAWSTSRAATSSTSPRASRASSPRAVIGPRLARDREIDAPNNLVDGRHRRRAALDGLERLQRRRPVQRRRRLRGRRAEHEHLRPRWRFSYGSRGTT